MRDECCGWCSSSTSRIGGLKILTADGAKYAGQGVIHFAVDKRNKLDYAIKFFCKEQNFRDESAQYTGSNAQIQQFLPRVRMDGIVPNEDGSFVDGYGRPMPPCIVMERGESLNMWVQRNKRVMDTFTCMQVQLLKLNMSNVVKHKRGTGKTFAQASKQP
jgi:hypothetical protein